MILPILRLVLIYFLLVAGVVAVFNRDKLAPLFGSGRDQAEAVEPATEPAEPMADGAVTEAAMGEPAPEAGDTADTSASAEAPEPVYPAAPEPSAPEADTNIAVPADEARPGNPGAPVTLGTPVANAPDAPTAPVADAVEAPAADTAAAEPATAPALDPAPATTAELTAPVADPEPTEAPESAPAPESEAAAAALAEEIAAARAAYWAGDIEGARTRMLALSEAHPDDPDVAGELGNLAFALRDYPAAAEAWHRAGLILIDRGESARVMSFLPFLQSIAPDKAAELAGRLQER